MGEVEPSGRVGTRSGRMGTRVAGNHLSVLFSGCLRVFRVWIAKSTSAGQAKEKPGKTTSHKVSLKF